MAPSISNQITDCANFKPVFLRETHQFRQPRHGAVFIHNFTYNARRVQSGQTAQIHRCFGVACPNQNTAIARLKWKNMTRRGDIVGGFRGINRHRDGARPIMGRDARCHPVTSLDRHGKGSLMA